MQPLKKSSNFQTKKNEKKSCNFSKNCIGPTIRIG